MTYLFSSTKTIFLLTRTVKSSTNADYKLNKVWFLFTNRTEQNRTEHCAILVSSRYIIMLFKLKRYWQIDRTTQINANKRKIPRKKIIHVVLKQKRVKKIAQHVTAHFSFIFTAVINTYFLLRTHSQANTIQSTMYK